MRRVTLLLAAMMATLLLAGGPAVADDPPTASDGARLAADGAGQIRIDGNVLVAYGTISGRRGLILVSDRGGDAKVTLNGRDVPPTRIRQRGKVRETRIRGARGRFLISGTKIQLTLRGRRMSLSTVAVGTGYLSGRGTYSLNDAPLAPWNAAETLQLVPQSRGRRTRPCMYCSPARATRRVLR